MFPAFVVGPQERRMSTVICAEEHGSEFIGTNVASLPVELIPREKQHQKKKKLQNVSGKIGGGGEICFLTVDCFSPLEFLRCTTLLKYRYGDARLVYRPAHIYIYIFAERTGIHISR